MISGTLKKFMDQIGYEADDITHIRTALTHSSYADITKDCIKKNEKYEFLGDAVLGFVSTDHIFRKYTELSEGELTRLRAAIVCEQNLCACARKIGLGRHIFLGRGEELSGGRDKPSILSDTMEALIGGIYLDKGIASAADFILRYIIDPFLVSGNIFDKKDFKSLLQEAVQQKGDSVISYEITGSNGPDHDKTFFVDLFIDGALSGSGTGRSKKEAEQAAAEAAYTKKKEII
jgi:ribonuclease III